jgi:cytochrome c553
MPKCKHKSGGVLAVVAIVLGVAASAAQADDRHDRKYGGENRGKPVQPAQTNAKWRQECASCHIAYAPGLLPAESWRKVMAGLDKHFGSDATLTTQENKEITDFLVIHASNRWSAPTAPLTITGTAWFKRKHDDGEIAPAIWKNPLVKSPANCGACHPQAENGDFEEHDIRMPR